MQETEIWKNVTIEPFVVWYQVSNLGRVRSLGVGNREGRVLKLHRHKRRGYLSCTLSVKGFCRTHLVHRLVGLSFIANPENKREINHKDGNRQNNTVENLEWMTSAENNLHSYRVLHRKNPQLGKRGCEVAVSKKVVKLNPVDNSVIKIYDSLADAQRELGVSCHNNLTAACAGRSKSAYGFKWRYEDKAHGTGVRAESLLAKPVIQMDELGSHVRVWNNSVEAARFFNCSGDFIKGACRGKYKTGFGFKWRFATAAEIEPLNKSKP